MTPTASDWIPSIAVLLRRAVVATMSGHYFEAGRCLGRADALVSLVDDPETRQRVEIVVDYVHELAAAATVFAGREQHLMQRAAHYALLLIASR